MVKERPKPKRTFMVYNALYKALGKSGVSKPGAVATLLLECFTKRHGILTAADAENAGVVTPGNFKIWRADMIDKRWLAYDHEFAKRSKRGSQHQAGERLIPHINKQNMKTKQIATEDQVREIFKALMAEERNSTQLALVK